MHATALTTRVSGAVLLPGWLQNRKRMPPQMGSRDTVPIQHWHDNRHRTGVKCGLEGEPSVAQGFGFFPAFENLSPGNVEQNTQEHRQGQSQHLGQYREGLESGQDHQQ